MAEDDKWQKRASQAFQAPEPVTADMLNKVMKRVGVDALDINKYHDMLIDIRVGRYDGKKLSMAEVATIITHPTDSDATSGKDRKAGKPSSPK